MLSIWRAATVAAAGLFIVSGCTEVIPEKFADASTGRPECRHDWRGRDYPDEQAVVLEAFSGNILNVPEYHDCQRLIEAQADGSLRYGLLAAVFAPAPPEPMRDSLSATEPGNEPGELTADSARPATSDRAQAAEGPTGTDRAGGEVVYGDFADRMPGADTGVTIALVHIPYRENGGNDGAYEPLGIEATWTNSCVVVMEDEGWMLPLPNAEFCQPYYLRRELVQSGASPLKLLEPVAIPHPVAPAARWGYDSVSKTHYIGAVCAGRWCMVGDPDGFSQSPSREYLAAGDPEMEAVLSSRNYYDEQPLAEVERDPNGVPHLVPSANTGTVSPYKRPDVTKVDYAGKWDTAAFVFINPDAGGYEQKFGFDAGDKPTIISLCHSTATDKCKPGRWKTFKPGECTVPGQEGEWYARITNPGGNTRYFCVQYREHKQATIENPASMTRWRWLPDDETVWIRCRFGCCEVAVIREQT